MGDWRDEIESVGLDLVPNWRSFPIESYAAILRSGRAAATKKRYPDRDSAKRDASNVVELLRYYRRWHPELAPQEFGHRVWASAEDGQYRWAILPTAREQRLRQPARPRALGRPA